MSKSNKISYLKTKRLNIFLLFVVLALMISILSKLSITYTRSFQFRAVPVNVPEDHVIISDSSSFLNITITTHGFKQAKYYLTEPKVKVDFNTLDRDSEYYKWIKANELANIKKQFDADVNVENINPDTLLFRYDQNFVKMIPVKLNSGITYASGYDLTDSFNIKPKLIKVIGPKIVIDSISHFETEYLSLKNINKDIEEKINLKMPFNSSDVIIATNKVEVSGQVERFTEGKIDVPISIINIPDNHKVNYYPKKASVIFYTSLNNYESITTSSFIVECDYKLLTEENTFLVPKIVKSPKTVKSARLNIKQVEFILTQ